MTTKYNNTDWFRLSRTGGAVVVSLVDVGGMWYYSRGNNGVSLPCKGCWVAVRDGNAEDIYMSTAPDCTPEVSPYIPIPSLGAQPLWIPISDVDQLSFSGNNTTDKIDIVYLLG